MKCTDIDKGRTGNKGKKRQGNDGVTGNNSHQAVISQDPDIALDMQRRTLRLSAGVGFRSLHNTKESDYAHDSLAYKDPGPGSVL